MKIVNVFNMYSAISQSTIIISPIGFNITLTNVNARLKQRCINVVPTFYNVVMTSGTDAVSTLYIVKNLTSDFVSFSTSNQRYFNVDRNVDSTLKCWLTFFTEKIFLFFTGNRQLNVFSNHTIVFNYVTLLKFAAQKSKPSQQLHVQS